LKADDVRRVGYTLVHPSLREAVSPLLKAAPQAWDLGAGQGLMGPVLVNWGAPFVFLLEKEAAILRPGRKSEPKTQKVVKRFHELLEDPLLWPPPSGSVAWLGWPSNRKDDGLNRLMEDWPGPVVYCGLNDDGTVCGHPSLFDALRRRPILAEAGSGLPQHTLVYGLPSPEASEMRSPHPWEQACYEAWTPWQEHR
jgi:hypothetical protein